MLQPLHARVALVLLLTARFATSQDSAAPPSPEEGWPRQITREGTSLITYQPQVDDWKDFKILDWRMAVSLKPKGGKAEIGSVTMQAKTEVDNDTHLVLIHDLKIQRSSFPSLDPGTAATAEDLLRTFLPPTVTISLERIVACTPKKATAPAVQLKNDPPKVFVSYKPAVLLDLAGQPVLVPVKETHLEYVMNTSWRLIHDKTSLRYYFLAGEGWLTATMLEGPWTAAAELPKEMEIVAKQEHFADLKDFVPLRAGKYVAHVPTVFYSTVPAEVILFEGHPSYTPVPKTKLFYADNTVSYVFMHTGTRQVYYLTAGRWFSAPTLEGPWTYATPNLPEDFTHIPASSPAAQVLASVPGTEQAKDAVLMAQIPTTAVVDPQAAESEAKVEYDGEPKFAPIEGTSLEYATNTAQKVIKLGDSYYLCLQGVWFASGTPKGPWKTAASVPDEIYKIPASSPVYNVTYVTQTTLDSGEIEAGYTSGYTGEFLMGTETGVVVAAGTGWYYPPYIGYYPGYWGYPAYYGYPYTYGAAAWHNSATGRYGVSQTAYGPYGSATRRATYNPYTGTATRSGTVSTPYGRVSAGRAYNPYTGAAGATRQASNAYSQWGSSVVAKNGRAAFTQHYSDARGTVGTIKGSQGGGAIGAVGSGGNSGFVGKSGSGDVYAGRDGNVYRNSGNGWQKYDNGAWTSPEKPTPQRSSSGTQTQNLRNESMNRQRGAESTQRFQQRSAGGGGARAMRGGRRR
jgi:hypothetical protein